MYLLPDKSSHDIFSFWLRPAAKSIEYQAKRKIVIEWGGEWLDQLIPSPQAVELDWGKSFSYQSSFLTELSPLKPKIHDPQVMLRKISILLCKYQKLQVLL